MDIQAFEKFCDSYQRLIILLIILLSSMFRVIYYNNIKNGPALYTHTYEETDMNFFHEWAEKISNGDYLTDTSLHPYHTWHAKIAASVYRKSGGKNFNDQVGKKIWNYWYKGKRFHQEPFYPYLMAIIYIIY